MNSLQKEAFQLCLKLVSSVSTLAQGAERYARATSASAGKRLLFVPETLRQWLFASWYLFFCVCCVCADCLPHKLHVCEWLQCRVHFWKYQPKKDTKKSGSDLWPINQCIPNWWCLDQCCCPSWFKKIIFVLMLEPDFFNYLQHQTISWQEPCPNPLKIGW